MTNVHVRGVNHVGVLSDDLEGVRDAFAVFAGVDVSGPEPEPELGLEVLWVTVGELRLEFIRPLDPGGSAADELRAGRGGVHHVALTVDDVDGALATVRDAGLPVMDEQPRRGVHGSRIAFLDRGAVGGALVELVQNAASTRDGA